MLLSAVVFLPLLFALIVVAWPNHKTLRHLAFGLSIVEFLISLGILEKFVSGSSQLQMVEQFPWIERFGITYFFGIDGLSLWLVLLTTFLTPIILLGAWNSIEKSVKGFLCAMFVLQTAWNFSSNGRDLLLFVLGAFFGADVLHHRYLGRRTKNLRHG